MTYYIAKFLTMAEPYFVARSIVILKKINVHIKMLCWIMFIG